MKIGDILRKQESEKLDRILDSIKENPQEAMSCNGEHVCPSCRLRLVSDRFKRCFACQRKWRKIFEDCVNVGWPDDYARLRADVFYPFS